jgi:hypothetical protein
MTVIKEVLPLHVPASVSHHHEKAQPTASHRSAVKGPIATVCYTYTAVA